MADSEDIVPSGGKPSGQIPFWLTLICTIYVAVLIPAYAVGYGLANFLWFSNIALLSTILVLWCKWRLLAAMQLVSIGLLELAWTVDFGAGLLWSGGTLIGLASYMFDDSIALHLRLLSLYHLFLPWVLLWLVWRLGYDRRAWWAQTLLAWAVLVVCYLFTSPDDNINWTFGLGERPQTIMPPWLYLALLMLAYPLLVYLPTHMLVRWLLGLQRAPQRA